MSDPTLAEALEDMTQFLLLGGLNEKDKLVLAAARERLEMGEGEQVWWCETHSGSRTITHVECDKALLDAPAYPSICRMVPARLFLDKGDE